MVPIIKKGGRDTSLFVYIKIKLDEIKYIYVFGLLYLISILNKSYFRFRTGEL